MFADGIAEHAVTAQPLTDAHVFPREGVGHASHTDLAAFGWVWPVHAVLAHEPAVVKMFADGIAEHAVTAQPLTDAQVFPREGVGHASHTDLAVFGWV
jgi:hypothetical protein